MLLKHLLALPWARLTMLEMPEITFQCSLASAIHQEIFRVT